MAYASIAGKARTSSRNPQAHAICDRCGGRYNHVDLQFQYDWAGATMQNKRLLVCRKCLDAAQQQLRAIALPGDPPPIINPRPENFTNAETSFRVTEGTPQPITVPGNEEVRITENDNQRITGV